MKKILAAFLLVTFAATASFGAAIGAGSGDVASTESGRTVYPNLLGASGTQSTVSVGKLSTGVYLSWLTSTTQYALKTQHSSGTRMYGTASDSTAIMWHTAVKGDPNAEPTAANASAFLGGAGAWSVM